jgi:uncharacterized membrane protein
MIGNLVYFISVFALPMLFIFLCKKYKFFNFLGVTICGFLGGMLLGNLYPPDWIAKEVVQEMNNVLVPLGLILMLFSTDIRKWIKLSLKMLLGYVLSLIGVVGLALGLFFVFGKTAETSYIAGMLTGTYVGGTPNMAAVKIAFNIPENLYNQIFLCDAVASSVYLLFVMVFGQRVLGLILKKYIPVNNENIHQPVEELPSSALKKPVLKILAGLALSILVFAVPVGLWILVTGSMKNMSMVFIILSITLLAVLLSNIPAIRNNVWNYKTGDYLFSVFFTFLGSLTYFKDLANLPPSFLVFTFTILFGSVFIHLILCKICKIDRDTMIITSAAGIMSPPFIPAIANAIKNKDLMAPGIAVGIVGLALGNVLGIFVVKFLTQYIH